MTVNSAANIDRSLMGRSRFVTHSSKSIAIRYWTLKHKPSFNIVIRRRPVFCRDDQLQWTDPETVWRR